MPIQDSRGRYTAVAQAFHWVIAALIVTQFVFGWMQVDLPLGMHKLALLARHKSFGMTVLILVVLRLAWRLFNAPPPLPDGMSTIDNCRSVAFPTRQIVVTLQRFLLRQP